MRKEEKARQGIHSKGSFTNPIPKRASIPVEPIHKAQTFWLSDYTWGTVFTRVVNGDFLDHTKGVPYW